MKNNQTEEFVVEIQYNILLKTLDGDKSKIVTAINETIEDLKKNHPPEGPFRAFAIVEWSTKLSNLRDLYTYAIQQQMGENMRNQSKELNKSVQENKNDNYFEK